MKNSIFKSKKYIRWFVFVIWMIIWYLAAHFVGSELILPGPHAAFLALVRMARTGGFWLNVLWTLLRTVLGIVISFAAGVFFAALAKRSTAVREFLRLPVNFFKSIPVMAIIIYVILVVKSDWVAVVVCFLMCFPIAYTNVLNGLDDIDIKWPELGRSLGLTEGQMVRFIIRPALDTQIKTALSLITAMSWKVVVASEVLAIPRFSIGYQMLNSKYYLETADLFAYIIVLIILSFAMEKLLDRMAGIASGRTGRQVERAAEQTVIIAPDSQGSCTVRFEEVSKSFVSDDGSQNPALENMSAVFGPGITAVLGPSGEGKTTAARIISGLEKEDSGEVIYEGKPRIAYLFQEDRLLPWLNARDNMLLSCVSCNAAGKAPEDAVEEMAEKLEIEDALSLMPHELSGGMAHRAALGRTLLYGGNTVILDEPFRGLDEDLRERITGRIMNDLKPSDHERTVILITHDEELAERLADRVVRL